MFLSKESNGYWYVYYETPEGKRHKVSTHTKLKTEALKFFRQFQPPSEQEPAPTQQTITLGEFKKQFLEYARTRYRPNTVRGTFQMAFNEFIRLVGDIELARVDVMAVEKFLTAKLQTSSRHAARHCYGALASAFQTAYRWKLIQKNPWREVKKPKTPEAHPFFLSEEEAARLIAAISDPCFKRLCIFALMTGVRASEAISLEWEAVDLEHRVIHVQNTETFLTKSMKNRVVPMNDTVYDMLTELPEGRGRVFLTCRGTPWARDRVTRWFKHYAGLANLDKRAHFHTLRHTFASWLAQKGVNLYEIKEMLGHASVTTTQIYAHLQPERLHATVNRISLPTAGP